MSKKIYFWKIRPKETLAIHTQESACAHNFLHMFVGLILRTYSDF